MPKNKKPTLKGEIWLILCDGLCIDNAPTEAQAKAKKKDWEKLYPPNMKFEIKCAIWGVDLAGVNPAHVTAT